MKEFDLRSLDEEQMMRLAETCDEKSFRGKQLFEWIHKKRVSDFSEIRNLPKHFL